MMYPALLRWFLSGVILLAVCFTALPVIAADQAQEIAARALLGEAEKLMELSHSQDALPILDRVQSEYPGTEAAAYAEFRRAEAVSDLSESLRIAQGVVRDHPNTLLACWAQCVVGESLIASRDKVAGITALLQVAEMLPDESDLGPLERAENALAVNINDDLDGLRLLGKAETDRGTGALLLSMLVSNAARRGAVTEANALLSRMQSVYSDQTDSLNRALSVVEAGKVRKNMMEEPLAAVADTTQLRAKLALMEDYPAAENSILLARNCVRKGNATEAVSILEEARQNLAGTQKDAQILYELSEAIHLQGRLAEALPLYEKIADEMPASGYVAPALYSAGTYALNDPPVAIRLLTRLAEGGYDMRWRGLAYWQLGGVYRLVDNEKARACFSEAIRLLTQCLAEQKADVSENWQDMMRTQIEQIQFELATVDQEVSQ